MLLLNKFLFETVKFYQHEYTDNVLCLSLHTPRATTIYDCDILQNYLHKSNNGTKEIRNTHNVSFEICTVMNTLEDINFVHY